MEKKYKVCPVCQDWVEIRGKQLYHPECGKKHTLQMQIERNKDYRLITGLKGKQLDRQNKIKNLIWDSLSEIQKLKEMQKFALNELKNG